MIIARQKNMLNLIVRNVQRNLTYFFLRAIIVQNSEIENFKCAHYGETFTFFNYAARLVKYLFQEIQSKPP